MLVLSSILGQGKWSCSLNMTDREQLGHQKSKTLKMDLLKIDSKVEGSEKVTAL